MFSQEKRIKVECFSLKLCVLNKNESMLEFLLDGNQNESEDTINLLPHLWNLGHILQVIRYMVETKWLQGLNHLLRTRRVKNIFGSVNDT